MTNEQVKVEETKVVDDALLLVKGARSTREENSEYVKKLAIAVATTFQKKNVARERCIGNGAIGNGVKAHAIAVNELSKKDICLVSVPSFQTVDFDGQGITSLVRELKHMVEDKSVLQNTVYEMKEGEKDEALLLVKGVHGEKASNTMYVKQLATAIATTFQKRGIVRLRCIGDGAIGNAEKAHAIAKEEIFKRGVLLGNRPYFQTVHFDDTNEDRTSLVLELRSVKVIE